MNERSLFLNEQTRTNIHFHTHKYKHTRWTFSCAVLIIKKDYPNFELNIKGLGHAVPSSVIAFCAKYQAAIFTRLMAMVAKCSRKEVLSVFFVVINITAAAFRVNIFVSYVRYLYVLIKKVVLVYCNMYWL